MPSTESVDTRLNRLERRTAQLRLCVFLLVGYVLLSSGVGRTIANISSEISDTTTRLRAPTPSDVLTKPKQSLESLEQEKPETSRPAASKPALTKLANVSDLVRTRRLQLINNDGEAVVDMFVAKNGAGVIDVDNADGTTAIQLYGGQDWGGYLQVFNESGDRTFTVDGGEKNGAAMLRIKQPTGELLMYFGASTKGNALISLGGDGKRGILRMRNDADAIAATLAATSESKSGKLWLNNAQGKNLLTAGESTGGNGGLWLRNKSDERVDVTLASTNPGGSISLYNSDQKKVFYAGLTNRGDGLIRTRTNTGHDLFYAGPSGGDSPGPMLALNRMNSEVEIAYLGETTANNAMFELRNQEGDARINASALSNQGVINSYNSNDNITVQLDGPNGNGRVRTWNTSRQNTFSSDNVTISGSSTSGLTGDIDGDGDVDGDDFLLLSHHFGRSSTKKATDKASGK